MFSYMKSKGISYSVKNGEISVENIGDKELTIELDMAFFKGAKTTFSILPGQRKSFH